MLVGRGETAGWATATPGGSWRPGDHEQPAAADQQLRVMAFAPSASEPYEAGVRAGRDRVEGARLDREDR